MDFDLRYLRSDPIACVESKNLHSGEMIAILKQLNEAYHNGEALVSDECFDTLRQYVSDLTGREVVFVGAPVPDSSSSSKTTLPFRMASLDKVKPSNGKLSKWIDKRRLAANEELVVTEKLDGISLLLWYSPSSSSPRIYTRGDGLVGCDVSTIATDLNVPTFRTSEDLYVRGELIVSKKKWPHFSSTYKNPRNAVAGIINSISAQSSRSSRSSQSSQSFIREMSFVVFQVTRVGNAMSLPEQLELAKRRGFETVWSTRVLARDVDDEFLSTLLSERRSTSQFEIDGVVLATTRVAEPVPASRNPRDMIAFKCESQQAAARTTVREVAWQTTKHGLLKPVVVFDEIVLGNSKIHRASGYNARWIKMNSVDVGSVVDVIKSGDVIPKITRVISHNSTWAAPSGKWRWDDGNVEIVLCDDDDSRLRIAKLVAFATTLGIPGLKTGAATKLVNAGIDTVEKLRRVTPEQLVEIRGFQTKSATRLCDGIREKFTMSHSIDLLAAANIFDKGFSTRKIQALVRVDANFPWIDDVASFAKGVRDVGGFSTKTIEFIVSRLASARTFLERLDLDDDLDDDDSDDSDDMDIDADDVAGRKIVLSGFRDKDLQAKLEKRGVIFSKTVTKSCDFVVVATATPAKVTSKIAKALDLNIPMISKADLAAW